MILRGDVYEEAPPGYLTLAQAVKLLGITRQTLHRSGLYDCFDIWKPHRSVSLFDDDEVRRMRRWLIVRQGLIALEMRSPKSLLVPTEEEFIKYVEKGEFTHICYMQDGHSICCRTGVGTEKLYWCPKHGVVSLTRGER